MIEIVAATAGDLDAILDIEQQGFAAPRSRASFERELTLPHARLDVARQAGAIVGFCNTWHLSDEVQLLILAVAPAHRRRGLGERLLAHVVALAGAAAVTLEVRADNTAALALYARGGFAIVGRRRGYYPDGCDAVLMTRAATGSSR